MNTAPLGPAVLDINCEAEAQRISEWIPRVLTQRLHRRGLVVAISGGIDSSVCAALSVRALGPKKVFGLLLPERDSSGFSTERWRQLAEHLGIDQARHRPALEALGCYSQRDEAIRRAFRLPMVENKIVMPVSCGRINFFKLVVEPAGEQQQAPACAEYLQIVAATTQTARAPLIFYAAG
jgi:NAD+ synthase